MAETRFRRMGVATLNAEPGLMAAAEYMRVLIGKTFQSQGRRAGGSWKQLTPWWYEHKQTLPEYGGDPRIGFFTGALYDSFTRDDADGSILDIGPNFVNVGSDLPYAEPFDVERPIRITYNDSLRLGDIIQEYMVKAWEEGAVGAPPSP